MAEQEGSGEATSSSEHTPLSEVFGGTSETHVEYQRSASEDEATDENEEKGDQKFPISESSPDDDEKGDEKKEAAEKQSSESKKDSKKEPESKSDTEQKEEKSSDDKQPDKWDVDDNPFKKRWQDTHAAQNREHQENLQLRQAVAQMQRAQEILQKKVDGTYDPEVDEPKQPSYEDVATRAIDVGKTMASQQAAIEQHGEEKVNTVIGEFNQIFGQDKMVNQIVLQAKSPVHEAMRIMERYHFEQKYGSSPADWHKNIRAEVEKELRDSLRKELTEEIMGKIDKKRSHPSFSSSRGSNGLGKGAKPKGSGPTPLKQVFGR